MILETGLNVLVILALVAIVRLFVIAPFVVKGSSMENNFISGEYIIIDKISYKVSQPNRGDVVVFMPPLENAEDYYIKRVIGMPGERVKIEEGKVYICEQSEEEKCKLLDESSYLNESNLNCTYVKGMQASCNSAGAMTYDIPEGSYFLMGDNRRNSCDSRVFKTLGCDGKKGTYYVPMDNIEGKSLVSFWPFNMFGLTPGVKYSE